MFFLHDGNPVHFGNQVRLYLDATYPLMRIVRGGTVYWPARSPNHWIIFCGGLLKTLVYQTKVTDLHEVQRRVEGGCNNITATPGIFERETFFGAPYCCIRSIKRLPLRAVIVNNTT